MDFLTKNNWVMVWGCAVLLLNIAACILNAVSGNLFFVLINGACTLWVVWLLYCQYRDRP
jgi:hypothetical protein